VLKKSDLIVLEDKWTTVYWMINICLYQGDKKLEVAPSI